MNRKGIELLRQVRENSEGLEELLIQDLLPNKFKQFIKTFVIGPKWTIGELILVNQNSQNKVGLAHITMYEPDADDSKSYHACLDYFFDYTRLLDEIEKYKQKTENWNALGFVQIGLMHWADVLLLGVEESNQDEIWRYGTGLDEACTKLENDIFDFISKLEESIDQENLDDNNIDINSIYKNLNESFWRHQK